MLLSIVYWGYLIWLSILTARKILTSQEKLQNLDESTLNKVLYYLMISPFLVLAWFIVIPYILITYTLFHFLLPLLFGLLIFESIMLILILLTQHYFGFSAATIGYVALTATTTIYAHSKISKRVYFWALKTLDKFTNNEFTRNITKITIHRVSKGMFRVHVYLILVIVYLAFNLLNFENILNTDPYKFINESFLTFVIIDTIIVTYQQTKVNEATTPTDETNK